ncbi:MAG: hypothetical protein ACLRWP_16780 [Bilophila wadsworthia]
MPAGEVIGTASNVLGMLLGVTPPPPRSARSSTRALVLWGANISETYRPTPALTRPATGVRIVMWTAARRPPAWAADQLMPLPGTVARSPSARSARSRKRS